MTPVVSGSMVQMDGGAADCGFLVMGVKEIRGVAVDG